MRKRIRVIPEPDGTLLVECGEDVLEVVIANPVQQLFRILNVAPQPIDGPGEVVTPIYVNPNDETMILARPQRFDTYSTHSIITALSQIHKDPGTANPTSLFVCPSHGINLHGAVDFAGQMQTRFPGVDFTIDLGLARNLK